MASGCLIPANPDIAGVGIRISLYAQAILVTIPFVLGSFSTRTKSRNKLLKKLFEDLSININGVLVTGSALLIAAWVQAGLSGLDLYHGLILLNLSWLNILTVAFAVDAQSAKDAEDREERRVLFLQRWLPKRLGIAIYLSAVGSYGIWLSCHLPNFGSLPECDNSISWVVLGHPISATATGMKAFLMALSSMAALPIVNIVLLWTTIGFILWITCIPVLLLLYRCGCTGILRFLFGGQEIDGDFLSLPLYDTIFGTPDLIPFTGGAFLASTLTPGIMIIVSTEQLIAFNKHLVEDGENAWTFGQLLTLLLLVLPLWQIVKRTWESFRMKPPDEPDDGARDSACAPINAHHALECSLSSERERRPHPRPCLSHTLSLPNLPRRSSIAGGKLSHMSMLSLISIRQTTWHRAERGPLPNLTVGAIMQTMNSYIVSTRSATSVSSTKLLFRSTADGW